MVSPVKHCPFYSIPTYEINWEKITKDLVQSPHLFNLTPIRLGASNKNFRLQLDGKDYFVRFALNKSQELGADVEIEHEVLKTLSPLEVSPIPVHFNKDQKILILEFLHADDEVDLSNENTRKEIISHLRKIENSNIAINKHYHPADEIQKLLHLAHSFDSPDLGEKFLPSIERITPLLMNQPKKTLCHFDLHRYNIIKEEERYWIIDWEYATMSHPFLTLASMASIERWDDGEMKKLLTLYDSQNNKQDFSLLYLFRIVADIHWYLWNHIQSHNATTDNPYEEWKNLFLKAAMERLHSTEFEEAINDLTS